MRVCKGAAAALLGFGSTVAGLAQTTASSHAPSSTAAAPVSAQYAAVQARLHRGWNSWDVHSVTTEVLLPEGLAIHAGMQSNSTEGGDAFLGDALIGRLTPDAETVKPGPHAWDGSYTELRVRWHGHAWQVQTAHAGADAVMLVTPGPTAAAGALPPTAVFSVDFLWNRGGTAQRVPGVIRTRGSGGAIDVYCTCEPAGANPASLTRFANIPVSGPYFAADLAAPVAISTGRRRTLAEVQALVTAARSAYEDALPADAATRPIVDAMETTLGWDTIYEPTHARVISPVSRVWSVNWGGYVIFDWDTFFAATMAGVGDRDLAYADALETLREETKEGFVPNYARAGGWKSFDRSEPPVGAITVLGLYRKFGDRWLLADAYPYLLRWNEWWAAHRQMDGYLVWGSDGENIPRNLDDGSVGTRAGAILESGLDNSPMYDTASYNAKTHLLEFADVGLMSMYVADCKALAQIADVLGRSDDAAHLRARAAHFGARLQTLWNPKAGIYLNKDLRTGAFSTRLSPTNFYPMLAQVPSPAQAQTMVEKHLLNPDEFWTKWVIPSIAANDPAYHDQNYWRGRIWGPMNYLVYLGLENYELPKVRREFALKSYDLFLGEWRDKGHVHENYNGILGTGDDVRNSDRFYHWGALLGYVEYLELSGEKKPRRAEKP